jgi:TonB family protein
MKSFLVNLVPFCIFVCVLQGLVPALHAQSFLAVEPAAQNAADAVAKAHKQKVLVFDHLSCQLDMDLCAMFEASFHDSIGKSYSTAQFVTREDVVSQTLKDGFIALDVDFDDVLENSSKEAGAEILVTDGLEWQQDGYEVIGEVLDLNRNKQLDEFRVKVLRPVPDSGGMPLAIKDPETGVSLLVSRGTGAKSAYPACVRCPEPQYTSAARQNGTEGTVAMLATINLQGAAEHIDVINDLKDGLSEAAAQTVQNWQFRPATGADGKPLATRTPVKVTFRINVSH